MKMNKIVGYRNMLGMTQEKMAKQFDISVQA
ncbi:DNA-binding XRE family transcriptional regulator [Staphylococcus borealis]